MSISIILRNFLLLTIFFTGAQASAAEFKISVDSPFSIAKMLAGETGKKLEVTLEFQQINAIESHGLAVILPSSTADMRDELFYATKMHLISLSSMKHNRFKDFVDEIG